MAGFDEEIRVAIVATADGVAAGTEKAAAAVEDFEARVKASTAAAASAYADSQKVWAAAQANAARVLADTQAASVGQIEAAYDALNAARDASLANAQAYLASLWAVQKEAIGVEDYAAQQAAQSVAQQVIADRAAAEAAYDSAAAQLEKAGATEAATAAAEGATVAEVENAAAVTFNASAQREASYAIGELVTGRYGRLETTMFSLGARTGLLTSLMTPAGLAVAGFAGAVVALSAAAIEGSLQEGRLNDALLATNDAAGLTLGQLDSLTARLAGGDTTIGEARDAILALARGGKLTGDAFSEAAQAVVDFANLTGQSTEQAAKYVETLATATTQQLIKANEQYHFLSLAQFDHIEKLREEGKTAEATQAIMDAFYSAMHSRAQTAVQDEGYLARGWDAVKRAASGALHAIEQIGVPESLDQQIAKLKEKLAELQNGGGFTSAAGYTIANPAEAAAIEAQIAALEREKRAAEAAAAAKAKAAEATDNAISAKYGSGVKHAHGGAAPLPAEESTAYSDQVIAQDRRILDAMKADADQRARIAEEVNNIEEQGARRHAQAMLAVHLEQLRTEEAQGKISHAQEFADEQKLYADEYAAQLAAYQQQLALAEGKPAVQARINTEIEALQDAHLQKMTAMQEQAAQKQARAFQQALAPITSAFTTSINGIIMGTQTMQMAVANILDSIALKYVDHELKKLVLHLATEHAMTAATVMGNAERWIATEAAEAKTLALKVLTASKTIAIDAAEAAAGAFKAIVGIPYVGPFLAPAAAAAALIEVKNLAHFDQGAWSIPQDMPAMVHQNEMILPRPFADDFRSAIAGRGGAPAGDGVHLHLHGVFDEDGMRSIFSRHDAALADTIRNLVRTGGLAA